ncbi:hypothetical protein CPC08DRAFT_606892, partial [Agrocybe pediades]
AILGRELFLQFTTVVILTQQIRVRDAEWINLLNKLRVGECTEQDLEIIRGIDMSRPNTDIPDFSKAPWNEAILVTSRHEVRERWNEEAVRKHCHATGNIRYVVPAEDVDKDREDGVLSMEGRLALAKMKDKEKGKLSDTIDMAIGIKVMVLVNMATEADIANGTRGEITDILLDQREPNPIIEEDGSIKLRYLPQMILFKPD